jgi:AAA15 family ATPase/GTPase
MKIIEINNFKAFNSRIALIPTESKKSLLIYGENGSGKSSVFEAIKIVFYHKRMLSPHITTGAPRQQKENEERTFYDQLCNKKPSDPSLNSFSLSFNGTDFKNFNANEYLCFMLSNTILR